MKRQKSYYDIFHYIVAHGKTTRRNIEKDTGYSWGTVSSNVCALIDDGYIKEGFPSINGVGRSTYSIFPNPKYVAIGIDVVFSTVTISVTGLAGDELYTFNFPFDANNENEACELIIKGIDEASDWIKSQNKYILYSIGLSCQGGINANDEIFEHFPFNSNWKPLKIRNLLEERYKVYVSIHNDMEFLSTDYCRKYWKNGSFDLIIRISDGIGFSFAPSSSSFALKGDFGHMIIKEDGDRCFCGKRGCLEEYCSVRGLLERTKLPLKDRNKLLDNYKDYESYFNEAAEYLGIALINILSGFRIDNIVLTGQMSSFPNFVDKVKESYNAHKGELEPNLNISVNSNLSVSFGAGIASAEEKIIHDKN